jgi:hypothetical protein
VKNKNDIIEAAVYLILLGGCLCYLGNKFHLEKVFARQTAPPVTSDQIANDKAALQASIIDSFTKTATLEADSQAYTDQQLAALTTQQTAEQTQLDQQQGTIGTMGGQINASNTTIEAVAQQAALALKLGQSQADYPYAGITVAANSSGQLNLSFTTLKPMAVWVNYGGSTAPYTTRGGGCVVTGTLAPPSPVALGTTFSFILPTNAAPHGCLKLLGQDGNGSEWDHGVVY